ncbi:TolC family protein, partial [bacterium]|nr:TolC family protein [bacterium]
IMPKRKKTERVIPPEVQKEMQEVLGKAGVTEAGEEGEEAPKVEKPKSEEEKVIADKKIEAEALKEDEAKRAKEEREQSLEVTGEVVAEKKSLDIEGPPVKEVAAEEKPAVEEKVEVIPEEKPKSTVEVVMDEIEKRKKDMLFFEKEKDFVGVAEKERIPFEKQIRVRKEDLKEYDPEVMPKAEVKIYVLDECIKVALNNHLPAQIALEKVKLAKLKLWDARRNLYPQVDIEAIHTTGEASALPFIEQDYKMQMNQKLYDGGAKAFLLKQAKVNLEVAKKTYDKVKSELVYEVEEAYYNFIMAKMNLNAQRHLLIEASKILEREEKLLKQGLTRKIDYMNMKASFNNIQFQISNAVKDLSIGELSLRQVMGLANDVAFDIPDDVGYKEININLQDSLWLAYKYRPEYIVNKLMVEYNELERKAKESQDSFQVDATGKYGYAGSAYESQILHLEQTWYAGLKISKPFGGSTVEANIVKEDAIPRLGQTERGGTYSRSLKLSVLDNLKMFTEKKEADISFQEAVLELEKMERQIETDVRTAYYDYQKALIQLDAAYDKISFREEEVKVNEISLQMGEGSAVSLLDTYVRLADEKSYYFQGLINYYLSIANMNKGIGLVGYYK